MLKANKTYLGCKQITMISEKNIATDKKYILRKMGSKFQNPRFRISLQNRILYIFFI